MDTVRIARDLGDVSCLLPEGVTSLIDAPYTLTDAIGLGLRFLAFEDLLPEERPDKSIWLDAEAMDEHFDQVRRNRERELDVTVDGSSKKITDPVDNDAASSLLVG